MEASLRARAAYAGVANRIAFLSSQPGDVVAGYMAACDCLVIPSRNESIPIVFSEALQANIPMLLSDVGDMGELARRNGLADPVPAADARALAGAMEAFARNPSGFRHGYEAARGKLLGLFDVGATADRYLDTVG